MITKIVEELKKSGHEINEETVRLVLEHASNMVELPTTESFIEQTKHNITLDLASGTYEMNVDSDGVKDDDDACFNPDCNIVDTQGCPKDTDGDGLDDCKDDCPSEYGERQNQGCPSEDADNDGVADDQDNCYNPGCNRVDSRGCPYDSDGDGLNDCEDNCPNQSGSRNNNGCPEPGPSFCLGSLLLSMLVFLGILFKT